MICTWLLDWCSNYCFPSLNLPPSFFSSVRRKRVKRTNKNTKGRTSRTGQVVIEVTKDDYRRDIRSGVSDERALQAGRHVFRRGGFKARHPDLDVEKATVKVRVNIYLERDIVDYFKAAPSHPTRPSIRRKSTIVG